MNRTMKQVSIWEDMSGQKLDPGLVKKAREEEILEFNKHGVYIKVLVKECWDATGRAPIGCRWVDVNKGTKGTLSTGPGELQTNSNKDRSQGLFAATPSV